MAHIESKELANARADYENAVREHMRLGETEHAAYRERKRLAKVLSELTIAEIDERIAELNELSNPVQHLPPKKKIDDSTKKPSRKTNSTKSKA